MAPKLGLLRIFFLFLFFIATRSDAAAPDWKLKVDSRMHLAWQLKTGNAGPQLSASAAVPALSRAVVRLVDESATVQSPYVRLVARQGSVATALVDIEHLPEAAEDPAIEFISTPGRAKLYDDPGMVSVRTAWAPTKFGITGEGVLVGIIDTGIDWRHPDFRRKDGTSRIAAILDLSDNINSLKGGDFGVASPYGGILVTQDKINRALNGEGNIREADYMGHGTLVAGCAAGGPGGEGDTLNHYGGAAPGAEIIAVKINAAPMDTLLDSYNIYNGLAFVDSLARALGRPCAINLSLGSSLGSHDGTSDYDKYVAGFAKPSRTGRALTVSAGNERTDRQHASGKFTESAADSTINLGFMVEGVGDNGDDMHLEVWLSHGQPGVKLSVYSPDSSVWGFYSDGAVDSFPLITSVGIVQVFNSFGGPQTQNGDRLIWIDLYDGGYSQFDLHGPSRDIQIAKGLWTLSMSGRTGSFDAYMYSSGALEAKFTTHIDEQGTVGEPATAPEVISVGAYVSRTDWPSLEAGIGRGAQVIGALVPGELAAFSSLGPNRKGVLKPEITAPGEWVLSALSRSAWPEDVGPVSIFWTSRGYQRLFFAPDSIHTVSRGTSFSAPIVCGICALLLQADPTLNTQRIKDLLTGTASRDSLTSATPDNFWGYGRANATAALANLITVEKDSLALRGNFDPPDTLWTDSLKYSINAYFTRSSAALRSFELELSWRADILAPSLPLQTGFHPWDFYLEFDTTLVSQGKLGVKGSTPYGLAGEGEIVGLVFNPRSSAKKDGVEVSFSLNKLTGDLGGVDFAEGAGVFQAGAVALRPGRACLMRGDVSGDGKVDIFDLLALLRILSGVAETNGCADLNGDDSTNIFDLLELLRLL